MKVLIVEDEDAIAEPLREGLRREGFDVDRAATGAEALAAGAADVVLLDLRLPDVDGLTVCGELRKRSNVPIIVVSARSEEADRVIGLELGADDYVVKPFSPKELVARIRAVLRRSESARADGPDVLRAGEVEVDVRRMRVSVAGKPAELTPTEFQLLAALIREPGRVFTRSQLLDAVHGVAIESYERAIDAHVKNVRKKIEPVPGAPRYLLTVYGVGYRFADA
ncbi:MAG: response regulator transcription factor [Actinobacteria bacterium]|nr:MAG: response regulator transcription factor [Actinomycetota bacterium]